MIEETRAMRRNPPKIDYSESNELNIRGLDASMNAGYARFWAKRGGCPDPESRGRKASQIFNSQGLKK